MKIIILSASTGGGHMSAAKAIKEYLTENECASEVVDALEYISPILNKTVTETYEYIATKNPLLWKMIYNSSNKQSLNKLINIITSLIGKKLMPLINEKSGRYSNHSPFYNRNDFKIKKLWKNIQASYLHYDRLCAAQNMDK